MRFRRKNFCVSQKRQGMLDGVCITGGEPLVNKNVDEFAKRIKDMGYLVKLDTNGTFPDKMQSLIDAGLVDYVAMDIKNSPEKYAETVGLENSIWSRYMRACACSWVERPILSSARPLCASCTARRTLRK